jgi:hypothetical protein
MVSALFFHERIETTEAKARVIRRHAEKLITLAKRGLVAWWLSRKILPEGCMLDASLQHGWTAGCGNRMAPE